MITDAEYYGWIALVIIALIAVLIVLPLINRYAEYKERKRMFDRGPDIYHDDMEDYRD